jgi:hypothetical protein
LRLQTDIHTTAPKCEKHASSPVLFLYTQQPENTANDAVTRSASVPRCAQTNTDKHASS